MLQRSGGSRFQASRQIVQETLTGENAPRKRAGGVPHGVGPEFKPQYHKKKKNSNVDYKKIRERERRERERERERERRKKKTVKNTHNHITNNYC
jgi:hypothetical protein